MVTFTPRGGPFGDVQPVNVPRDVYTSLAREVPGENRDALASIRETLESYGLGNLLDWAIAKLIGGASKTEVVLELHEQPAFKERFPVIEERRRNGLNPVSAAEVMEYETTAREMFRRAGINTSELTSNRSIQRLMALDVSGAELGERLQNGLMKVTQAPSEVKAAFGAYFGANTDVAMARLFLDPDTALPELEKMASTAFAGGIGKRFGLDVALGIARDIADTGASEQAIWQGFNQINSMGSLFQESIAETEDLKAETEGVGAAFGTNKDAGKLLQDRIGTRTARFRGGAGIGATEGGAIGLGVAGN